MLRCVQIIAEAEADASAGGCSIVGDGVAGNPDTDMLVSCGVTVAALENNAVQATVVEATASASVAVCNNATNPSQSVDIFNASEVRDGKGACCALCVLRLGSHRALG